MAATIKDVAKYTGLSIATISKFINGGNVLEKNRMVIEEAIKTLDFKVNELARGLKTSKTKTIGILIPSLENIFCTSVVSSIENILLQYGYSTIICDYRDDAILEKKKLEFLMNKMVDGLIIMPLGENNGYIKEVSEKGIPIVSIDRILKSINCDMVLVDNLNASYDAVEHLIVKGHKRIGIICGPEEVYTAQERLKGYLRVHEDYSMEVDDQLIKHGDYKLESGYEILMEFLDMDNPPTAVYVTNYDMTLGAIIAINEKNIVIPEELSIIGFDNLQMARIFKPALSIVVQPMKEIGETAASVLLKRLAGDLSGFPHIDRLKAEVEFKDSVKALI
ncbi:LacI family DNA-binding transcriptional regulator [Clostridium sp. YIM B02515]|uniref:LacI family DNA-binding transcriptional regulator n=1 Tax=Clostridium rhizosphaerae TaxID=2803861 RepID=A0ABS1T5K0_9CLOT|nr:LacI family DNA-binding transcriptional regulator [Clostridium rhizosphaerae]MBL4934607.1 LacI family DNA-binding transcriptional regulator [Clostridium rhizosphaerae]